jgi:hypothetical protein
VALSFGSTNPPPPYCVGPYHALIKRPVLASHRLIRLEIILLCYPKRSIRIQTHAQRVSHALLVIVAYLRATHLTEDSVENFHLVAGAPIGHINLIVLLNDLFRRLKIRSSPNRIRARDSERLPVILNRVTFDSAVRSNEQFAIRLKGDAAKVSTLMVAKGDCWSRGHRRQRVRSRLG